MASRYPSTRVLDYCYHPIHVVDENKDILVPCGKCNGCLLHKANDWSMRLRTELEGTPNSIFFTLTYNNKYLPKLKIVDETRFSYLLSPDNDLNIRFDGTKDVLRKEDFSDILYKCKKSDFKSIQNFPYKDYTCYSSKRDIQLWLKILRKNLVTFFNYDPEQQKLGFFRYFIISEYGPTSFRSHIHGLIFPRTYAIAQALLSSQDFPQCSLYSAWKMCDKDRFFRFTHFADGGASGYVTNYITQFSTLPNLYKSNKELRPFRLSSKNPSIGFAKEKNEEIYENVSVGVIEKQVTIKRLGTSSTVQYSKNYLSTLFPKCERFVEFDFPRMVAVYGRLWKAVRKCGYQYSDVHLWLSAKCKAQDLNCMIKCYKFCENYNATPEYYCYLLDTYYYQSAMYALRCFYEYMESELSKPYCDKLSFIYYNYVNVGSFSRGLSVISYDSYEFQRFLESYGITLSQWNGFVSNVGAYQPNPTYVDEVDDIIMQSEKMPKFNELTGNSPHIV